MNGPGYPHQAYGFQQNDGEWNGQQLPASYPFPHQAYPQQPPSYAVGGVNLAEQLSHLSLQQQVPQQHHYYTPTTPAPVMQTQQHKVARVEDEDVDEGRSYLDHYGQDLRHMPKWRLIEMLRLSQEQCEQLEIENQQLQACVEANRRETDDVPPPVPNVDDDHYGEQPPMPPHEPEPEPEFEPALGFELALGSTDEQVQLAYPEGVQALVRELEQAGAAGEACAGGIATDGFRALTYLTRRLAELQRQPRRQILVDEYGQEYEEELQEGELSDAERRDMQVESIRVMLLVGQRHPAAFPLLAQSLATWLTPDLTVRGRTTTSCVSCVRVHVVLCRVRACHWADVCAADDPERLFYDLTILTKICSQPSSLPTSAKGISAV